MECSVNDTWVVLYKVLSLCWSGDVVVGSYGSWMYNYLCNQCLSSLTLWVRIPSGNTTLYEKVYQLLAGFLWFSPGTQVSSTNKTDRQDITETLLKVALCWLEIQDGHQCRTNLLRTLCEKYFIFIILWNLLMIWQVCFLCQSKIKYGHHLLTN